MTAGGVTYVRLPVSGTRTATAYRAVAFAAGTSGR
jgi:hypothetical protein